MSDWFKKIDIKNCKYYFFDGMKNQDRLKAIQKYSYCYTRYVMLKHLSYATIKGVNFLYLNINNINGYIDEGNEMKM